MKVKIDVLACSIALAVLLSGCSAKSSASDPADRAMADIHADSLRAEIRFLADDQLQGRGTATPGHELAAKYMASQFEALGLQPAGDNGTYFQSVPMRSSQVSHQGNSVSWTAAGKTHLLSYPADFTLRSDAARPQSSVDAPVVFVGYGITSPELHRDDYQGIDARGKIVAYIYGAPSQYESSMRAYYSDTDNKRRNAVAHGAVGMLRLTDPDFEHMDSYQDRLKYIAFPDIRWVDKQGQTQSFQPELRATASVNLPQSRALLQATGHSPGQVFADVSAGKIMSFDTPIHAHISVATKTQEVKSPNVVAILPGSDSSLRDQYVVFSAHLDHLGIGPAVHGDTIYHGALDNASGSADLIEIARALVGMDPRPRRSILFIAVTGEEADLLGSEYFAAYPTVPKSAIVGDVNIDEDLMLWPLEDIVCYGVEHSTLSKQVAQAAARLHLDVSPDPQPEQVIFIRSDQYSFVEAGIPAVFPNAGWKSDNPAINPHKIDNHWEDNVYHTPLDNMSQPFDWDAGVKFAQFNLLVGYLVAQQDERPAWNPGDFFSTHFGPGAQK